MPQCRAGHTLSSLHLTVSSFPSHSFSDSVSSVCSGTTRQPVSLSARQAHPRHAQQGPWHPHLPQDAGVAPQPRAVPISLCPWLQAVQALSWTTAKMVDSDSQNPYAPGQSEARVAGALNPTGLTLQILQQQRNGCLPRLSQQRVDALAHDPQEAQ